MNIVIFDDDITFIDFIKESLNKLNEKFNSIFTVSTFCATNDIMAYVDANKDNASFYILDIMKDRKEVGFLIAEHVKKMNEYNTIIFVTDYAHKMMTNSIEHKTYALAFIFKESDCFLTELEYVIKKTLKLFDKNFFLVDSYPLLYRVKYKDILYFKKEKLEQKIRVVCKDGEVTISGNLKNLMPTLNGYFCYAAQDYIVNTELVVGINKIERILFFSNGMQCPYSRKMKEELINKCQLC